MRKPFILLTLLAFLAAGSTAHAQQQHFAPALHSQSTSWYNQTNWHSGDSWTKDWERRYWFNYNISPTVPAGQYLLRATFHYTDVSFMSNSDYKKKMDTIVFYQHVIDDAWSGAWPVKMVRHRRLTLWSGDVVVHEPYTSTHSWEIYLNYFNDWCSEHAGPGEPDLYRRYTETYTGWEDSNRSDELSGRAGRWDVSSYNTPPYEPGFYVQALGKINGGPAGIMAQFGPFTHAQIHELWCDPGLGQEWTNPYWVIYGKEESSNPDM